VAERALVGEAQVWAAVGEREAGTDVRRQGTVRVADQELAAHPQVREQRFAAFHGFVSETIVGGYGGSPPRRTTAKGEPEVLAASFGAQERAVGHGGGEPVRAGGVTAHRARVKHLGCRDRAPHDMVLKPGADSLNLRQFRHNDLPSGAFGLTLMRPNARSGFLLPAQKRIWLAGRRATSEAAARRQRVGCALGVSALADAGRFVGKY
jgi:hypothetical protein